MLGTNPSSSSDSSVMTSSTLLSSTMGGEILDLCFAAAASSISQFRLADFLLLFTDEEEDATDFGEISICLSRVGGSFLGLPLVAVAATAVVDLVLFSLPLATPMIDPM